jgi:hypothetical protein
MSKVLWNPTNEELFYAFGGITFFFQPGEKRKVEDAAGKHLLHNLGIRGLTVLDYDCDEKKIGADAIARNLEFKRKTVVEFNQRNEQRKQTNFPYLVPTEQVAGYAKELGVKILEPYVPRDNEAGSSAMTTMKAENESLKTTLEDLTQKMAALTEMVMNQNQGEQNQKIPIKQQGGKNG